MRLVITGANGQVGRELVEMCHRLGDDVIYYAHHDLDIADQHAVRAVISQHRPEAVVNCAALTATETCESNRALAMRVNADGAGYVAVESRRVGAHLVHLSTDYVFSGDKGAPYTEDDEPGPINVYGQSKLAGEHAVLEAFPEATVVRTSWVCGAHGKNVVRTVLRLANEHATLRFVNDQYGSPTFTADLAPLLRSLADGHVNGLVHATNDGVATWFDVARSVLEAAGHDPNRVTAIPTEDLQPAPTLRRPKYSALANTRLEPLGSSLLPPWEPSLRQLVYQLVQQGKR